MLARTGVEVQQFRKHNDSPGNAAMVNANCFEWANTFLISGPDS